MSTDPTTSYTNVVASAVCLCDVGSENYLAAVAIGPDGQHLVLAQRGSIGDDAARYDPTCAGIAHEQTGPLPIEYARRVAAARRRQRGHQCGHPTKAGRPCRITVAHPGEPCGWHRQNQRARKTTTKGTSE
ncbi:hypothetical protein [Mycobacterium sp. 852002-51961_SCH5331710]|uniref:hypothetical protein n=1 Tax=Mycobacterium sp. 852002-51961_SCH5331710 TaxID=1834105 RepID=UPI0007FF0AEA|nr:hypothetical protein [Mycobacterium sp. 852002-51961_SCH5331710]OBB46767.1 hypothetical protein A5752_25365 [Mycobacterium sp. 852002-51961_SCH5331710]